MIRGTHIAAVVLAIGAFACERKHDDKAGDTTTTSGTFREEQGVGTYGYQGSPGVTGNTTTPAADTTGTDRNDNAGKMNPSSGTSLSADQSGSLRYKDAGIATDFEKKDGGHVSEPSTGSTKAKTGGKNTSTSLGDGTSGESTGGQGTYGGKATHGTGTKK